MKKYNIKDLIKGEAVASFLTAVAIMAIGYACMWFAYIFQ